MTSGVLRALFCQTGANIYLKFGNTTRNPSGIHQVVDFYLVLWVLTMRFPRRLFLKCYDMLGFV